METHAFEDLYDIEQRPGAGVALWTKAVELQLERVRETNYRHRLNESPNEDEQRDDMDAEWQLHSEVYFLALAVRRVQLFHELVAKKVDDPRLANARRAFEKAAPTAKALRDFYEHLDEYLLDSPDKHQTFPGRASPMLHCTWSADNVIVCFGPERLDITLAAMAAVKLGHTTEEVWGEHLERVKPKSTGMPAEASEHKGQMLEIRSGVSTIIGSRDDPPELTTGILLAVRVRDATPDELALQEADE